MLAAWKNGDADALRWLAERLYPEMRRIARRQIAGRRAGDSMESAALANEAYLKLLRAGGIDCENRVHFLAVCSQMMRRILLDHARRRYYAKRGGGRLHVTLDQAVDVGHARDVELVALDEALNALAEYDSRKCRVVELRHFGGLSIEETAEVLGVSLETAKRDWRMARAWLYSRLRDSGRQTSIRERKGDT